jgi:hypothetical protein
LAEIALGSDFPGLERAVEESLLSLSGVRLITIATTIATGRIVFDQVFGVGFAGLGTIPFNGVEK